jgi:hypothetical protein
MGTTFDDLSPLPETTDPEFPVAYHADGTSPHAAIPFSGLFDGPEIPPPAIWL